MTSDPKHLFEPLESAGFFAAYSLLGDGNFRSYDWDKMLAALEGEHQELWRFFLLGGRLSESRLRTLLGERGLGALKALKVCKRQKGELSLGSFSLLRYQGATFLADRAASPKAYFGDDTRALITLLPSLGRGKGLCLHSNSSLAALPLAARSKVQFTFSKGPHDKILIAANMFLNGATGGFRVQSSPESGGKGYDIIIAACPSTFEAPGVKMPATLAAGPDGLKHLRALLGAGKRLLAKDGCLLTSFLFYAEADSKAMRTKLAALLDASGLGYTTFVCSKHTMQPGVPVFNMLFSMATANQPDSEAIARKMMDHVAAMKYEAAYLVKMTMSRDTARRNIFDFSDAYYGSWTF